MASLFISKADAVALRFLLDAYLIEAHNMRISVNKEGKPETWAIGIGEEAVTKFVPTLTYERTHTKHGIDGPLSCIGFTNQALESRAKIYITALGDLKITV